MFGFGSIFMVLFWIVIFFGIVSLFRHEKSSYGHATDRKHRSSVEILKERYAKGEITKEEFVSMKKDIE